MEDTLVHLMIAEAPFQIFAIEECLKGAGIPYTILDHSPASAFTGSAGSPENKEFMVPEARLQEAKDALCASGIVCEVSERLLKRALEEIVMPLLQGTASDRSRLVRFIEVNNKDTVRALVEATLQLPGGQALMEDLFFSLDRPEDATVLRSVARALAPTLGGPFFVRLREAISAGPRDSRVALLEAVPELPEVGERSEILAIALRDPGIEVREAAAEALFSLKRGDYGYEPDAPEAEREEAIERFLAV